MTQDDRTGRAPQFNIGRILVESFSLLLRNFVPFIVMSVVIAIPSFLIQYWQTAAMRETIETGVMHSNALQSVIGALIGLLTQALTQSALTYGTLQDLRGRHVGIGECIARGLSAMPKVAIAAILWSLMVGFASILLLVPGIILIVMFWVYVPAIVVENAGITECFGRSRELTRGQRWSIFGLFALIAIVLFGAEFIFMIAMRPEDMMVAFTSGWTIWVMSAVGVVITAYASVMTSVGYYYLRAEKEGIMIDDIVKVFD